MYKTILAVDVGATTWGWAFCEEGEVEAGESGWEKTVSFDVFYGRVKSLLDLYNPDLVVVGKPNRFYNVVSCQSKYIGVCCLACEKKQTSLVEVNDSSVRAILFPGTGASRKQVILDLFEGVQPDEVDAIVMAKGSYKMFCEA